MEDFAAALRTPPQLLDLALDIARFEHILETPVNDLWREQTFLKDVRSLFCGNSVQNGLESTVSALREADTHKSTEDIELECVSLLVHKETSAKLLEILRYFASSITVGTIPEQAQILLPRLTLHLFHGMRKFEYVQKGLVFVSSAEDADFEVNSLHTWAGFSRGTLSLQKAVDDVKSGGTVFVVCGNFLAHRIVEDVILLEPCTVFRVVFNVKAADVRYVCVEVLNDRFVAEDGIADKSVFERKKVGVDTHGELLFTLSKAFAGDAEAAFEIGNMCGEHGDMARFMWDKAATNGHAGAGVRLGDCYEHGKLCDANPDKAFKYYKMAADTGDAEGKYRLAQCYLHGVGTEKNAKNAFRLFKSALDAGHDDAGVAIGIILMEGTIGVVDISKAMSMFKTHGKKQFRAIQLSKMCTYMQKAEPDSSELYFLGQCYYKGEHLDKDYGKAYMYFKRATEMDYGLAWIALGELQYNGYGMRVDLQQARMSFTRAVSLNIPDARAHVARMYLNGDGVLANMDVALMYLRDGISDGSAMAANMFDILVCNGVDVRTPPNEDLQRDARNGKQCAILELGNYYRYNVQDHGMAFKYYSQLPSNAIAIKNIADCYRYGLGISTSAAQAFQNYTQAAQQGLASAQLELGKCYLEGNGTEKDRAKGLALIKKAAEQGLVAAQLEYGKKLMEAKDAEGAVAWYEKASAKGSIEATVRLGDCYYQGTGVMLNFYEARRKYERAEKKGDVVSMVKLGKYCYDLKRDFGGALRYFRKAEKLDQTGESKQYLGMLYFYGLGGARKDITMAVRYYRESAEMKFPLGQTMYGNRLYNGEGEKKDVDRAKNLYGMASRSNEKWALFRLGLLSETGETGEKNEKRAATLFLRAAREGHDQAQYRTAQNYASGTNLPYNPPKAKQWLQQAAKQNNADAKRVLNFLRAPLFINHQYTKP